MKKVLSYSVVAIMAILFSACNGSTKEVTDDNITEKFLVGQWKATQVIYNYYANGELLESGSTFFVGELADEAPILEFFDNGQVNENIGLIGISGTYTVSEDGTQLAISDGDETEILGLKKVSNTEIEVSFKAESTNEGITYLEEIIWVLKKQSL